MTRELNTQEFGRLKLHTIPLPEGADPHLGTYTASGRVAVWYTLPGETTEDFHIITVNDDGTDICTIYEGKLDLNPKANGFRYMPFPDNKRVYIGDYILECEPDCDHVESAKFVPIHYPDAIANGPGLWMIWSENVAAPDGEHIAWSTLSAASGVYVAKLRREADCYELDNIRCVSNAESFIPDPEHPGCMLEPAARGGEVKQFVRGGKGLSYVGVARGVGNSMYQALDSDEVTPLSLMPGYDETAMISPDEKLALVMTSRFSPSTNCAIVGLIPRRGNMLTKRNLAMDAYLTAIAGPRIYAKGANVGPALVHLDKAITDMNYMGVDLHDPEDEYIYYSPLSWHPAGKKGMWVERIRQNVGQQGRLTVVELLDYEPSEIVAPAPVPENIPYATEGVRTEPEVMPTHLVVAGKAGGFATTDGVSYEDGYTYTTVYDNFTDDNETFINGSESMTIRGADHHYEGKLSVTGTHTGGMDCKIIFKQPETLQGAVHLDPASTGYAEYDGVRIDMNDMVRG